MVSQLIRATLFNSNDRLLFWKGFTFLPTTMHNADMLFLKMPNDFLFE